MQIPIKKNTEIEVTVLKMSFGGRAIAKINSYVIFIENALVGDKLIIRITKTKKNFAEAYIVKIIEPSPYRIEPSCKYFGYCGGCKWQFIEYEKQLEYKTNDVKELLEKVAFIKNPNVLKAVASPEKFHYRNKMEFTVSPQRWLMPDEICDKNIKKDIGIGLHVSKAYNKIVDIDSCKLQNPSGDEILEDIRSFIKLSEKEVYDNRQDKGFWAFIMLRYSTYYDKWLINIVTKGKDLVTVKELGQELTKKHNNIASIVNNIKFKKISTSVGEEEIVIFGDNFLKEKIKNYEFTIFANSFFQTNTKMTEKVYEKIEEYADLKGDETVLDLYSGTGTIPIFLSKSAYEIFGIEIVEGAVENAIKNAEYNNVTNCKFIAGDTKEVLPTLDLKPNVIIADPPRVGMHKKVIETILDISPEKIIYISCNPSTLARDMLLLKEKYELCSAQPFDMFPHTYHIETVARLIRKNEKL